MSLTRKALVRMDIRSSNADMYSDMPMRGQGRPDVHNPCLSLAAWVRNVPTSEVDVAVEDLVFCFTDEDGPVHGSVPVEEGIRALLELLRADFLRTNPLGVMRLRPATS